MIDGLALGETTPGPLIMVVACVGFIGASTQQVFGPDLPLLAGIARFHWAPTVSPGANRDSASWC